MTSLGNKTIMAQNIKYYMNLNNLRQSDICTTLKIPMATFSDWVNAKSYPRIDKIELMANYFGISKSDLVEDKSTEPTYYINPETQQLAQELYDNPEMRVLFDAARDCSPEEMQKIVSMIEILKGTK